MALNIRQLSILLIGGTVLFSIIYVFSLSSASNSEMMEQNANLKQQLNTLHSDVTAQQAKLIGAIDKLNSKITITGSGTATVNLDDITEKVEAMAAKIDKLSEEVHKLKTAPSGGGGRGTGTGSGDFPERRPWEVRHFQNTPALDAALDRFIDIQSKILAGDPSVERKYILAEAGWAGMTNRLQSLVSIFLFCMLTDRAFILEWREASTGFNPNLNNEGNVKVMGVDTLFKTPFDWSKSNLPGSAKKGYQFEPGSKELNGFLCGDLNENFPEDIIKFTSWDYFGIHIAHNPKYRDQIVEWFGSIDNIYRPLAHFLFRPIDSLQEQIDTFIDENFREYTIGVHLRTKGNTNWVMTPEHVEAAFQCAGIGFGDGINPPGQASVMDQQIDPESIAIFVAADDQNVVTAAKEKYGPRVVSLDGAINRVSLEGLQRGMMDMWILSRCDDLVLSYQSSYSRSAAALAGILPLIVTHEGACLRDVSNEPCSCAWLFANKLQCYDPKLHYTPYAVNQVGCFTCDGMSRWQFGPNH